MGYSRPLLVIFLLIFLSRTTFGALPADAQKILDQLPEKSLSLDLVLARAMKSSDSFKSVQSLRYTIPVAQWSAESILDTRIEGAWSRLRNQNESSSVFSPTRTDQDAYSLGLSKYFITGTSLNFKLAQTDTSLEYPVGSVLNTAPYFETTSTIYLTQNLWKDSFGYGTRRYLESGEQKSQAQKLLLEDSTLDWAYSLIQIYYDAWLAQARAKASDESLKRREQLLNTTKIKLNRGTSEEQDYLQVRSAYLFSKNEKSQNDQNLQDRWRNLVVMLKLPDRWLNIDAKLVPLQLDSALERAKGLCSGPAPENSISVQKSQLLKAAAENALEKAKMDAKPDLELQAGFVNNGIDASRDVSFDEVKRNHHPSFSIGVVFSMPLEMSAEKAQVSASIAEQVKAEAATSQAKGQLKTDWINECKNFERLQASHIDLEQAYHDQQKRTSLESRRFQVGRTTTFNVIQAGDDATQAELLYFSSDLQRRLSAWRLLRLTSKMQIHLEQMVESQKNVNLSGVN